MNRRIFWVCAIVLSCLSSTFSQQPASKAPVESGVPRLVSFGGMLHDPSGQTQTGITGITFAIYKDQFEGAALWMETQTVVADKTGHYTVQLGSTRSGGLPADLFASGEARWLGVQVSGQTEQPRVLLLSVPYALKAGDAATVGGLPPSAFVLAAPPSGSGETKDSDATTSTPSAEPPASSNVTTTGGTVNAVPLWTTKTNIQSSAISQTGNGTAAKIGIGTSAPATTLDVKGAGTIRGALTLPATAPATSAAGKTSQPLNLIGSSFNSVSGTPLNQTFRLQTEPVGNNTAVTGGTLNLLYASGANAAAETGLKIASNGRITFASGQTFPSTVGTVRSVGLSAPSSDFTVSGSPVTGSGTLNMAWKVAPTSADTANAIVKRDATGSFNVTSINGSGTFSTTTANDPGILVIASSANAVAIQARTTGSGGTTGISGDSESSTGIGVFGFGQSGTSTEANGLLGQFSAGVWGDNKVSGGVIGTSDNGGAIEGFNSSDSFPTIFGENDSTGDLLRLASPNGECIIDNFGDLFCTGSKSAMVPVKDGRRVALYAVEAPENWFEDFGSARLSNGTATVKLDPTFSETVNLQTDYHVFLTPKGDCKGLYVGRETAGSFEVRELGGGTSSVAFDYRIVAKRLGYESKRLGDTQPMLEKLKSSLHKRTTATAQTVVVAK